MNTYKEYKIRPLVGDKEYKKGVKIFYKRGLTLCDRVIYEHDFWSYENTITVKELLLECKNGARLGSSAHRFLKIELNVSGDLEVVESSNPNCA